LLIAQHAPLPIVSKETATHTATNCTNTHHFGSDLKIYCSIKLFNKKAFLSERLSSIFVDIYSKWIIYDENLSFIFTTTGTTHFSVIHHNLLSLQSFTNYFYNKKEFAKILV